MRKHIVLDRSKLLGFRICKQGNGSGIPAAMVGKVGTKKPGSRLHTPMGSKIGLKA